MLSRTLCCDTCHRQVSINDVPRCDKPIPDITRYHTPSNLTRISPHASKTQETEMLDSVSQYDPLGAQNKVPDTLNLIQGQPGAPCQDFTGPTQDARWNKVELSNLNPKRPDSLHHFFC